MNYRLKYNVVVSAVVCEFTGNVHKPSHYKCTRRPKKKVTLTSWADYINGTTYYYYYLTAMFGY